MSAAMRLPSRIGTIIFRSMMATDSNSFSSAVRWATSSGLGGAERCARPIGTNAQRNANARISRIFMTEECTAGNQSSDKRLEFNALERLPEPIESNSLYAAANYRTSVESAYTLIKIHPPLRKREAAYGQKD